MLHSSDYGGDRWELHHPHTRSEKTSQEKRKRNVFTSDPKGATSQARLHWDFGEEQLSPREDVKLSLTAQ